MKKPAKFTSSFGLLLKQGFRGLFKFKVQFSIILILSFLATLILTVSVGTTQHLQSNYDRIVKVVPRFAYSGTTQIGKTAGQNKGASLTEYQPVPLVDFANNAPVSALTLDDDSKSKVIADNNENPTVTEAVSSYNFILNDDLYQDQLGKYATTFITKFMKDESETGFYNLTNKELNNSKELTEQYIRDVGRSVAWRLIQDIHTYQQTVKNKSLIGDGNDFDFKDLSYLETTTVAFLIANQPNYFDFLQQWLENNGPLAINATFFDQLPYSQKQFIDYAYWNGILFGKWLASEFKRYVKVKEVSPTADVLYQHFLGVPKGSSGASNQGYYLKAAKTMLYEPKDESRYLIVAKTGDNTDQKKIDQAIVQKSFKGTTSPLIIQTNDESKISNVVFTNFYQGLSLRNPDSSATAFNKELDWTLNFNTVWNPAKDDGEWQGSNAKATIYQYHLQLTALASGYDITFRKESIFFDPISSRKFRYVIQNGFDKANFTILEGTGPSAVGEVAISEQFARVNKIKIGDYLAIGQTEVMVVGYGTDAFSFMPIVDPTVPIPEPKTGAFVYGSAQTLRQINDGFGGSSSNQDLTPHYYTFFLTDRANTWTNSGAKNKLFNNLQMDLSQNLGYNLANLETLKPIYRESNFGLALDAGWNLPIPARDVNSFWGLDDFNSSPYKLNWTILPLTVRVLRIVSYIASAVIALIALIALIVCINKTIIALSKQMGILKAIGLEPLTIAVTYLAYGLVIMLIVVPVAWGIGLALEIPFILLFGTYFSIELLSINAAWQAFLIAFFGFGILALLVSLITAYLILLRPVLEIFDVSSKWSTSRFFDFLKNEKLRGRSFNVRFSLTLASAGIQPILLLTTVIFLTSLLISGSLTIPAIANRAINSYYKNILYANSYTNMAPTVNSPLSKPALTYWKGNEVWDKDWVPGALKLDSTNSKYGYYIDPTGYTDSVSQNSVVPRYLYKPDITPTQSGDQKITSSNLNYSYVFIAQNQPDFLRYVTEMFGDNFFTVLGQGFSIGTVDQFLGLILNADKESLIEIMGVKSEKNEGGYDPDHGLDWNKQKYCIELMDKLAQGLPNIISQIIGAINGPVSPGNPDSSWKDQIVNAILTQVPPYIRSYIYKSPSRMEQFGIHYNTETYTPKHDSIFTQVLVDSKNYQDITLTGLDKSQNAFSLPANLQRNISLDATKISDIKAILAGNYEIEDISIGNVKVWNKQNKVLTIPFIDNKQARSGYHFDKSPVLSDIKAFGRQIKYHTNGGEEWEVLPRGAWIYDDSDFVNADIYKTPSKTLETNNFTDDAYQEAYRSNQAFLNNSATSNKNYLDLYSLDNNKFTYFDLYNDNQKLNPRAYMFNDFAVDEKLQLASSYVRPYYMYKNIQLYLPLNKINPSDILTSMTADNQGVGAADLNGDHPWYEIMNSSDVPQDVKDAWGNDNNQYLMIRPYDIRYVSNPPKGLERITNGERAKYWLRYAYATDLGPGALTYENHEPIVHGKYGENSPLTVNLQNVGTLNSYNSRLIIIDAMFANLLNNFSTARDYGYQNSFFTGPGEIDNSTDSDKPWPDKMRIYPIRDATQDIYVSGPNLSRITYLDNAKDVNDLAPLRWNSGKYSNISEPESLTSSVSFNVIDNLGQFSLGLDYPEGLGMTTLIKDQLLLSTQRALINQIFTLSISLAVLLIIAIVITGSLLIMLMGDIYIAKYQNFMILMRALGYSNREIQTYAFSVVSIFAFAVWIVATVLAWAIVFGIIRSIGNRGLAIPYGLSWWPIVVSLLIIVASFLGALWVSSYKVRHDPVSILMSES